MDVKLSWNLIAQGADLILCIILIVRLGQLQLRWKYLSLIVFLTVTAGEALIYVPFRIFQPFDYRYFYIGSSLANWAASLWMVYSLMGLILGHLPGIKRFCIWLLNVVCLGWVIISLLTASYEWRKHNGAGISSVLDRMMFSSEILDRAFGIAQILVIITVLGFILRFPIRVPRNLAIFSVVLSLLLSWQVGWGLLSTYRPDLSGHLIFGTVPALVMAVCLVYWITTISLMGENAQVTLGRSWQFIPSQHLVEQLHSLNASLLSSRDRA